MESVLDNATHSAGLKIDPDNPGDRSLYTATSIFTAGLAADLLGMDTNAATIAAQNAAENNYLNTKQISKLVEEMEKAKEDPLALDKIIRTYLGVDVGQSREMGGELRTSNSVMTTYKYEQIREELITLQNSGQCSNTCQDIVKGSIADIDFQLYSNKTERQWNVEVQPLLNLANEGVLLLGPLAVVKFPGLFGGSVAANGGIVLEGNLANVWKQPPTVRGTAIESHLAATEYKDWFNVGQLNNGKFPLVDFQNGNTLVSVKSVDTTGSTWMARMQDHIYDLGHNGATVNGTSANIVLDIRVQPGGLQSVQSLVNYGRQNGVTVIIKEFK